MEPAIRRPRPHLVFPREAPSIVPRPPPDWALEALPPDWELEAPPPPSRRRREVTVEPWPTSLLTLPAPVYQPLGDPTQTSERRRRRQLALGSYATLLALASLAVAFWQLYWLLESTDTGRALLDRAAAIVAAVADHF